jgi:protein-disulfide isomerase
MKLTGETKLFIGIILITIAIIGGAMFLFSRQDSASTVVIPRNELILATTHVKGNASASAYLVEYSDLQCPACKAFQPTVDQLLKTYGDKLTFAYRHFPLDQHPYALKAAIADEAAGRQGKFWEMHDGIFAADQEKFSDQVMTDIATKLNLDMAQFQKDSADPALNDIVIKDRDDGNKFGINSTPTFFLNGKRLQVATFDDLTNAVKDAVK